MSVGLAVVLGSIGVNALGAPAALAVGTDSIDASPASSQVLSDAALALTWTITAPDASNCVLADAVTSSELDSQACATGPVTFSVHQPGPVFLSVQDPDVSLDPVMSATVDVVPPAPAVTAAPDSPFDDATPSWSFDLMSSATATCTLTHGAATVQTSTGCTSPFKADDLTASSTNGDPGNYDFVVTQTVNTEVSAASAISTYDFEPSAVAAPTVTADNAHGTGRHPTFTVAGLAAGATVDCTVDPPAGGPAVTITDCNTSDDGSYQLDLSDGDVGAYVFRVTQTVGGVTSAPGSDKYVLDMTPPSVTVDAAAGAGAHPAFTISDLDAGTTPVCTVNGPSVDHQDVPCDAEDPTILDLGGDDPGAYTLRVQAKDGAGNVSDPVSATYEYEPSGPPPPVVTAPSATGNDLTPTFTVSDAEDVSLSYHCSIVGTDPQHTADIPDSDCGTSTTVDLTGLPDDAYALTVTVEDAVGNISDPGTATYTLDTSTPTPAVALEQPASSPSSETEPSYTFDDAETVDGPDTFSCVWTSPGGDPLSSGPCASDDQFDTAGNGDGKYTLEVTAHDTLGNHAKSTATYTLEADVPPAPTVIVVGATSGSSRSVSFAVSDAERVDDLTYSCTLSGGDLVDEPVTPCTATTDVSLGADEPDGDYTLAVTAADALGHTSDPGTATYSLDNVAQAPTVSLANLQTSPSNDTSPSFSIVDNELVGGDDTFTCTWSGPTQPIALPETCPPGNQFSATMDGEYTLTVTATDTDGNVSDPVTVTYDLDTTAPDSPAVSRVHLTSPGNVTTPTFAVKNPGDTSPGGLTYTCVVTDVTLGVVLANSDVGCGTTTTVDTAATGDGHYRIEVTATDAAGNVSVSPGISNYVLDTLAQSPLVTLASSIDSPSTASTVSFTIDDNELVAGPDTFVCTWSGPGVDVPTAVGCESGVSFPASVDGVYSLSVVATDTLGNVSSAGVATYERDATAQSPSVVLASPAGSPSAEMLPRFSIGDNEVADGPDTFMCTWSGPGLGSPSAVGCADGDGFAVAGDGQYTLTVVAVDTLGNVSDPAVVTYDYDGSAQSPLVALVTPAGSPSKVTSPSFSVTDQEVADGPDSFDCTWTGPGVVETGPVACGTTATFATADDGEYTLSVTATDKLGTLSDPTTVTYTYDGTAPDSPTVVLSDPASSPNLVTTPTFSVSNPGDVSPGGALTYACVVTNTSTGAVVAAADVSCDTTTTADLTATGDGTYTLKVTATDPAGNTSTAGTATYTLDATPPEAPTVALADPATSPGNVTSPTFSVSVPGDTSPGTLTYSCAVVETSALPALPLPGAVSNCGAATELDLAATGDGVYTLSVTAIDAAGNASTVAGTATYTLDTAAPDQPVVVLSDPAGSPGHLTTPTFSVSNPGDNSPGTMAYTCLVTNITTGATVADADVTCGATTTADLTATGDGDYTVAVTATDAAGNSSLTTGTAAYTLDVTVPDAPTVVLTTPTTSPSQDETPTFGVSNPGDVSPGGITYTCVVTNTTTGAVVGDASASCGPTTSVDLTATGDGTYSVAVTATDEAGNVSDPGSATYALDTTPPGAPTVRLTRPASTPGNVTTPAFAVSEPTDISPGALVYSCSVAKIAPTALAVDPASVSCGAVTTVDLSQTGDGTYVLTVSATDAAGNAGTETGSATYALDTTSPPAPQIVVPAQSTKLPAFGISDGDPTATLRCRFTAPSGATVFPTGSTDVCPPDGTFNTSAFGEGPYTLTVTATDPAGNSATATATWTRDTTPPPPATITAPVSPSNDRRPVFTIGDTESNVTFECVLSGPDSSGRTEFSGRCPGNGQFAISGPDGEYVLTVSVTDAAGNAQSVSSSATYVLDTAAPAVPIVVRTAPADSPAQTDNAEFSVTDPDPSPGGITLSCTVSGPTPVPVEAIQCGATSRIDLSGPDRDGTYTFTVLATDAAGNVSSSPGTAEYTLDTTPPPAPTVVLLNPTSSPGNVATPAFSVTDADTSAGVTFTCSVTGVTPVPDSAVDCGPTTTVDLSGDGRDGAYTLSVTTTDAAGNTSATAGTSDYLLDTQPPAPPLVQLATATRSNETRPLWNWQYGPDNADPGDASAVASRATAAQSSGLTATCRVSGPLGWASTSVGCAHHVRILLAGGDGAYTFTVTLADAAGNTASAHAATYHLDSTAPAGAAVFLKRPASTVGLDRHPIWTITGPVTSTFRCTLLDGGRKGKPVAPEATCTDPVSYSLAGMTDGTYTLKVVAVDSVGNRAFPAYASYILEPAAPNVKSPRGTGSLAVWTVIGNPNDRFECTLSRSGTVILAAHSCGAHPTYDMTNRAAGSYTLSVVQIGAADTRSAAGTASWVWSGRASNTDDPSGPPKQQGGPGPAGHHKPRGAGPLGGVTGLVRHHIQNVVHNSGQTIADHFPSLPHPTGVGSGVVSAVQNAVHSIGAAGGGTGFPLLLVGLVLIFLLAQNRIDRRDPKLALASIAADDMVEFTLPPSRKERP